MGKKKVKTSCRRSVLRFPDLDHSKSAVLNTLASAGSRRAYQFAIEEFIAWYCSEPRLAFNRVVVVRYACTWKLAGWRPPLLTRGSQPFDDSHMRLQIAVF
jgi:hypothetical protein